MEKRKQRFSTLLISVGSGFGAGAGHFVTKEYTLLMKSGDGKSAACFFQSL